ncbi:hypothetical protein [Micromonospora sp. ATCC 39149]|uniref:Uncharacterized protein n=1 Tax=Micromonospora carbonacea TaxID=47853 RepID=A0A7D6CFQ6_9ACTN|nr:hypothetical protein [Micromonospora sp. ATCC 39149]QLJ98431.1 hypothetical protein HZU44_27770 [Micromonospora carbonacea]
MDTFKDFVIVVCALVVGYFVISRLIPMRRHRLVAAGAPMPMASPTPIKDLAAQIRDLTAAQ